MLTPRWPRRKPGEPERTWLPLVDGVLSLVCGMILGVVLVVVFL